jgi:uncharacterized membrane protein YgaE (UPF0421/DUF939 family)
MRSWSEMRRACGDPVAWTERIQVVKTVAAALAAWLLAVRVFHLPHPFLAPWAALLVVHATVYRTFSRGVQQVLATVLGVLLAWAVGNLVGLNATAVAAVLGLGLLAGRARWMREEATTAAATALIVLTTGFSDHDLVLLGRLFDTAIGIGVGLVVNALVWPPLRDQTAARAVDAVDRRLGELLCEMAQSIRKGNGGGDPEAWTQRTREIDDEIDEAWGLVRQARESGRLNPRRGSRDVQAAAGLAELLDRVEQAVAETRSMARTLDHSMTDVREWDPDFRRRWVGLLHEAGTGIGDQDSTRVGQVRPGLARLAQDYSTEDLPALYWTEYGALIVALRNLVSAMQPVTASHPVLPERIRIQQVTTVRG